MSKCEKLYIYFLKDLGWIIDGYFSHFFPFHDYNKGLR